MGRRIDRRRTEPAGGGVAAAPLPRILAEFDLDAAHCLVIPIGAPLRVGEAEGAIGEFRVGDTRYRIVQREPQRSAGDTAGECDAAATALEDPLALLTAREQQIVRLICFGQVNKQIAYRLNISEYTVKTYLKQIFMKLNVHSRAAMVYRCARWVGAMPPPAKFGH